MGFYCLDLYSYSLKTGKMVRVKESIDTGKQYGRYLLLQPMRYQIADYENTLFDLKAEKFVKLPRAYKSTLLNNKIYRITVSEETNTYNPRFALKSCTLSGKNIKKIKDIRGQANAFINTKSAYFVDDKGNFSKLSFNSRQLVLLSKK